MKTDEKALVKAKKVECWIGIIFLIPPILGVIAFTLQLFDADLDFSEMYRLSSNWTAKDTGMSAAPLYLGLMALAGGYLIKDSLKYLFIKTEEKEEETLELPKSVE